MVHVANQASWIDAFASLSAQDLVDLKRLLLWTASLSHDVSLISSVEARYFTFAPELTRHTINRSWMFNRVDTNG